MFLHRENTRIVLVACAPGSFIAMEDFIMRERAFSRLNFTIKPPDIYSREAFKGLRYQSDSIFVYVADNPALATILAHKAKPSLVIFGLDKGEHSVDTLLSDLNSTDLTLIMIKKGEAPIDALLRHIEPQEWLLPLRQTMPSRPANIVKTRVPQSPLSSLK